MAARKKQADGPAEWERLRKIAENAPKEYTPDQAKVMEYVRKRIKQGKRTFILWYGGVRAGKSTGAAEAIFEHAKNKSGAVYGCGAYTSTLAADIFASKFEALAAANNMEFHSTLGGRHMFTTFGDNRVVYVGGSILGRDAAVQGLTWNGLILDELPNLQKTFINQCEARVSEPGALRVYTANKYNPYHWTTKYYYERAKNGKINGKLFDSNTEDNQHLDKSFIDERLNEYDEVTRARFIENEFALDKPAIFQPLPAQNAEGTPILTVIYGADNGTTHWVTVRKNADYMTLADAGEFQSHEWAGHMDGLAPLVLVNSDRPALARELRRKGVRIKAYKADFEPRRVEATQLLMGEGKLRLNTDLDELVEAIDVYHTGGHYMEPAVRCVELAGEYITRTKLG